MKKILLSSIIIAISVVFISRLFFLQIINFSSNSMILEDPSIKAIYDYPERGYIYDRNGELLVGNNPAYDIMVVPREVGSLDTLEFCSLVNITKKEFIERINKAKNYSSRSPSIFIKQLTKKQYAFFQEKMRKFDGFYIQKNSLRYYNTNSAANVLGYISEVNKYDLASNDNYVQGELIGRTGVENQYDSLLRGKRGIKLIQKDRFNRAIGSYKDGQLDTLPSLGKEIYLTIDKNLQEYGELLMRGKRGGIVALEPSSGEILTMISGPTYDPSILVGSERSKNYNKLHRDTIAKPLFDRSILAEGSPGSPFKALNALIALQEGVIDSLTKIQCFNGFYVGHTKRSCHCGGGLRSLNSGLYTSCNAYFAGVFRKIYDKFPTTDKGMEVWEKHVKSFGLGDYLGTDLPTGRPGRIPSVEYYDKWYGDNRWTSSYIISNSIGQGEISVTPMQLANMTAAIANQGFYYTPHILKKISKKEITNSKFIEPKYTTIDRDHFAPVIKGMTDVYNKGTARWIQIPGIKIAGKTGTVENFAIIDGIKTQLTDHSVFVAFAPVENPKIALAVYIENGYYGSRYAGHIASLLIEKYLKGKITRVDLEKRMLEKTLEHEYEKPYKGTPFEINNYEW